MQIWSPRLLEGPQRSQGQPGEPSQYRKGSVAPSTIQSLTRSFTTSHTSHILPITEESAIGFSFEKPGQPILVFYLSANEGGGGHEMSFLTIESKLRHDRPGKP